MQPNDIATKSYIDHQIGPPSTCAGCRLSGMIHINELYAPIHDPRFAEIEQILREVGVSCRHVSAYATEYLPDGTTPQTAQCITKKSRLLVNIISQKFTICVDKLDMYVLPGPANLFDIHDPDFFLKLAQYLRKQRVLSLPKYWFVRLKLWWNK